jgi:hypothetical protein
MDKKQSQYEQLCEIEYGIRTELFFFKEKIKALEGDLISVSSLKKGAYINHLAEKKAQANLFSNTQSILSEPIKGIKRVYKKRAKETIEGRVLKAIKSLGRGTARDVAVKLTELYPKYTIPQAAEVAKHHLSKLKGKKVLQGHPVEGSLALEYEYIEQKRVA